MSSSTYQVKLKLNNRQKVRVATIRNPDRHHSHSHLFSVRVDFYKEVVMTKGNFLDYYVDFVGTIQPTASWHLPTKVTIIGEPPLKDIFRDVQKFFLKRHQNTFGVSLECKLHTLIIFFHL